MASSRVLFVLFTSISERKTIVNRQIVNIPHMIIINNNSFLGVLGIIANVNELNWVSAIYKITYQLLIKPLGLTVYEFYKYTFT